MRTSDSIAAIAEALSKFQAAVPAIPKKRTATVPMKSGGSYSYKYADLSDIIDAVRAPLAANGLSYVQSVASDGANIICTTLVMHSSGEFIESDVMMLPAGATPQTAGSAITYARRYSLAPALGISPDEDDDGNAATNSTDARPAAKAATPATAPGKLTEGQQKAIYAIAHELGWSDEYLHASLKRSKGIDHVGDLAKADASALIETLKQKQADKKPAPEPEPESAPEPESEPAPVPGDDSEDIPF